MIHELDQSPDHVNLCIDDVVVIRRSLIDAHQFRGCGYEKAWAFRAGQSNVPFNHVLGELMQIVSFKYDKRHQYKDRSVRIVCVTTLRKVMDHKNRMAHAHAAVPWLWCQVDAIQHMIRARDIARSIRSNSRKVKIGGRT